MTSAPVAAATREAYPAGLIDLVEQGVDVVAIDADLSVSTMGYKFGEKYPERWLTVGVAEQNMVGIAAGFAATGKTAFIASFAAFVPGRCFDQLRTSVAQPRGGLSVKCVASHGGVTVGEDGMSAQAIEDLALVTSLIPFDVVVPADFESARQAIVAVGKTSGPAYVRTGRPKVDPIYDSSYRFELGKANTLRAGTDVTLIACGIMVGVALQAAEVLASEGVSARVLDMATIKPVDRDAVLAAARETGAIVTAEEHQTHGGLGTQVARVLAEELPTPIGFVGVDRYGTSGKWDELLGYFGLTPQRIAQAARDVIARKT
ncbi:MAG: transketolase family protein [Chloroflexi bacterium]|jgi:transketolase|nr:transketolase family protein [Dehalococcoidia bacterium]MCO5200926.1 transketolase family protein [Chloroflexota bacterium]MCZ7576854.1 transketolase family protein [Dehalococcoidia bacterium]NJD64387.1 transketolase family protein [Chloroflexota bacterium]PWB46901.1 MAG: transketolase [Dehalococcoidia bacterium]